MRTGRSTGIRPTSTSPTITASRRAPASPIGHRRKKVESGIKYVRGNFWLGLTFTDLADLNAQGRVWLDTVANVRVHGTTGIPPFTRLASDRERSNAAR